MDFAPALKLDRAFAARLFDELAAPWQGQRGIDRDTFGRGEQHGFDVASRAARELRLQVDTDWAGNLYMRLPGRDPLAPKWLCGSHLDSVPAGGNFDGAAGVVAGLAVLKALCDQGMQPRRGITVKLVNGETDEDVALRSPYNLFVGGNKLGRGVTIKNLLVSYYGRNPKAPQSDTVLQHARMYGYRRMDIGLLRLFLPPELNSVFSAINKMQQALRDLIARNPSEEFRGLFLEGPLKATRKNVLAPGAVGVYTGGSNYNPKQMHRDNSTTLPTSKIDDMLKDISDKSYAELPLKTIQELLSLTMPDESSSEHIWNTDAVIGSIEKYGTLTGKQTGYVYVDRDRGLDADRRETQGIIEGREVRNVPVDKIVVFMLRTTGAASKEPVWWPQVRFPSGRYAFAFAV